MGIYMRYCKYCYKELVNKRDDALFCDTICGISFRRAIHNKEAFKLSDHDKMIREKHKND